VAVVTWTPLSSTVAVCGTGGLGCIAGSFLICSGIETFGGGGTVPGGGIVGPGAGVGGAAADGGGAGGVFGGGGAAGGAVGFGGVVGFGGTVAPAAGAEGPVGAVAEGEPEGATPGFFM
ncbi:hypothetical protein ACFQ9Q_06860, partial [Streptomyces virginiae]|uniref:hypothetical protein n=1 Tax=Streptomyces virginiae TaxID=1961 RepID=UPI0036CA878D